MSTVLYSLSNWLLLQSGLEDEFPPEGQDHFLACVLIYLCLKYLQTRMSGIPTLSDSSLGRRTCLKTRL